MSSILLIILALAGALVPNTSNEFTVQVDEKTMIFERQPDKIWFAKKLKKNGKESESKEFKIDGLNVAMKLKGEFRDVDVSRFLGISNFEELKTLSEVKLGNETVSILKERNGFSLIPTKGPEFKVSWK